MIINISKIKENPNNPRTIKDDKFKKLVQSIQEFPEMMEKRPIIVDENMMVLGGNMRLRACREAGLKEVHIDIAKGWTEKQKKEFIIKDNIGYGEWDWGVLSDQFEMEDLDIWGLDLPDNLGVGEVEEDEAPEVSDEPPVSQLGEVYQLGRHRLMCGDSTNIENVEKLMNGQKADMVFTDPPYALFGNSTGVAGITDDKMTRPFFLEIFRAMKRNTKLFGHIYTCCDWHSAFSLQAMARESGLKEKNLCIWDKGDGGVGAMYQQCYEMVWFHANSPLATKTMGKTKVGERTINGKPNIWRYPRANDDGLHNAQKPTEMIAFAVSNSSDENEIVLDLFGGSGSTLIACEQTNRTCMMSELDPKYCDVIRKRYWKFINNGNEDGWIENTSNIGESSDEIN